MITTGKGLFINLPDDENYFLQFIKFMRLAPPNGPGWIVAGSCNNVTGTMGQDVIDDIGDIVVGTWVVLESPDHMVQLMFHLHATNSYRVYYNPNYDYSGGGVGVIPTTFTTHYLFYEGVIINSSNSSVAGMHILAEETFPYSFAVACYSYNNPIIIGGMLFCKFDTKNSLVKDHILMVDDAIFSESAMNGNSISVTPKAIYDENVVICSMSTTGLVINSASLLYPNRSGYRNSSALEVFPPSIFMSGNIILGTSNFIRWIPNNRLGMNQYGNRTILSHNKIAFPWDGETIPSLDPKISL